MSYRDERTASLLDALSAIENRLDPGPMRRGQRIADLITVALLAAAVLVLDFPIERPLLLVSMLALGGGATRWMRHLWTRRLRRERDRLLAETGEPALLSRGE